MDKDKKQAFIKKLQKFQEQIDLATKDFMSSVNEIYKNEMKNIENKVNKKEENELGNLEEELNNL